MNIRVLQKRRSRRAKLGLACGMGLGSLVVNLLVTSGTAHARAAIFATMGADEFAQAVVEPVPGDTPASRPSAAVAVTANERCPSGCVPVSRDSDRDGVPDEVERRTGTDPYHKDTDKDGIPDGVEDENRDGVVDAGESDPRKPGLFPGSNPHIPEPLNFDLVRGLGAKKGEVETNTLIVAHFTGRGKPEFSWAPEVEWAFADGAAIEFELPLHGRELEAFKSAFQLTLPASSESFIHGVQVIGEYLMTERQVEASALYIAGAREGVFSTLWMAGARAITPMASQEQFDLLLNPNFSADLGEEVTVGLELNLALVAMRDVSVAIVPQVHWQVSQRVRVQVAAGTFMEEKVVPAAFTRFVLE